MANENRGSRSPDDDLVHLFDAARHLGIETRALRKLVKQGLLDPIRKHGKTYFRISDVNLAAHAIHKGVNVVTAMETAIKALALAEKLQKKLHDLMTAFGVADEAFHLLTDSEVLLGWEVAIDGMEKRFEKLPADEVIRWTRFIYRVDVEFLIRAGYLMNTKEPWLPFVNLARAILSDVPQVCEPEVSAAYTYLEVAARHLREAAYLFCRAMYGENVANLTFPDEKDKRLLGSLRGMVLHIEDMRHRSKMH